MSQQNVQQWVDKSAVAILNTNIVVIIASYLFLNNEIFLQSRLQFDLFKLVDVTAECALMPSLQIHWCFPMYLEVFSKSLH